MTSAESSCPNLRRHLVVAAAIAALDVFVLGQGVFPLVVAFAMLFVVLYQVIRGVFGERSRLVHGLRLLATYGGMMAFVIAGLRANQWMAQRRASALVSAVESYKSAQGDYPTALEALVPRYVSSIPLAKYCYLSRKFNYRYEPASKRGFLAFTTIPPFGRRSYSLEDRRWYGSD